ncbi:MAG: response regulator [Anaerorhabdus sp.]
MYTVVIADDEYELRRAIVDTINWEKLNFKIVGEAENGVEALEMVELLQPDLLITDIHMPFLSGIDLAREARNIRPFMNIVFISGYDDFSYAQMAIQYNIISYLLKPLSSRELEKELLKIKKKIDDRFEMLSGEYIDSQDETITHLKIKDFLMPLLFDHNVTYEEKLDNASLKKEAMNLGIIDSVSEMINHRIIVLTFVDNENVNQTKRVHTNFAKGIIGKYLKYGLFYSKEKVVIFISGTQKDIDRYIILMTTEIYQSAKRILKLNCFIGISNYYGDFTLLSKAYDEAFSALVYSSFDEPIQYFSDFKSNNDLNLIKESVDHLDSLVKLGRKEEIEKFLNEMFLNTFIMENNGLYILSIQILSNLIRSVTSVVSKSEADNFLKHIAILSGNDLNSEMIKKRIKEAVLIAYDIISNQRKETKELLANQAQDLIKLNYADNELSISKASELLHVSASYLSSIIKKSTDSTFGNLLTDERMRNARELLLGTSEKVMEIANKCGYSDTHYFSYCVKRYYGLSPNKLREKGVIDNEEK